MKLEVQPDVAIATAPATRLAVSGMTCGNCARQVSEAIQGVPGVQSASVNLESTQAVVRWKPGTTPDDGAVFRAIRQAGYEPAISGPAKTELRVTGMTCSGCARNVVEALRGVPGVDHAEVQLEASRAVVHWRSDATPDFEALARSVKGAGYNAELASPTLGKARVESWLPLGGWKFNVTVGSILTLPLFVLEWGLRVGEQRWYHWLALALVLPVQTLCGARFYRGAWNQLRIGGSNMDTLVVLGSTTAFGYSAWALFHGGSGHLFFMESAAIITLISVGHWMESKASARATASLRALLNLAPQQARLLDPGGTEIEVPVSQLRIGDQIVIKPGDRVPIDSEVREGASVVDESMLTGESIPVSKGKGARVYGGTTNLHGWLLAGVAATGEGTALAQIIAVVERAQNSRAEIQRLGDRVSNVFVPVVVLVALATGLWWGLFPQAAQQVSHWIMPGLNHANQVMTPLAAAIYHAAAVLIVACPCAMGLATPIAIMAGTNVAAQRGILIRDGVALEKTGHITAVVFDKTGTLTEGKLGLAAVDDFLDPPEQVIGFHKIAASLAKPSAHPLSLAVASLSNVTLPTHDWQEIRGAGVQAQLEADLPSLANAPLCLGSLTWLRGLGVDLGKGEPFVKKWSAKGASIIGLAAGGRLLGLLALRDVVKPDAPAVLQILARQEKRVYLVTGDNEPTAQAIASLVGIPRENVFAQVQPEAKGSIVRQLQERGERVAFVGDGINDAPALEQADLGIAVARASDVAREAADLILLKSDIRAVPEALALAQATLRTIKQNLFWAFFYNACGVPLAALGFLSPIFSAFAMGASDLVVIGNALRLRRWQTRQELR
jgi:Cu+-exporting ATPase